MILSVDGECLLERIWIGWQTGKLAVIPEEFVRNQQRVVGEVFVPIIMV